MATIYGTDDSDNIIGTFLGDVIFTGLGNDIVYAGGGNDIIYAKSSSISLEQDYYDGESGTDTLSYENFNLAYNPGFRLIVHLDTNQSYSLFFANPSPINIDQIFNIENIIGSVYGDEIYGNFLNNVFTGLGGDDTIYGAGGDDIIKGDDGADFISGGTGADLIYGRAGNDAIYGDEQNDLVFGDNGNDFISLGIGDDSASGGLGDDTINGDDGNDTIYGDDGNDIISGGLGDDTINGGTGDDTINGNENNDIIHGNDGIDNISGGVGNDTLYGDAGNDTLNGDDGNDIIYGNAGSDIINGGNGTDTVSYLDAVLSALTINLTEGKARGFNNGNEEIDTLQSIENVIGSNSTDYITGDNLTNYLQGMGGNDFFYWTLGNDYYDGGDGADVVTVTAGSTTPMTISYGNTFSIERFIGGSNNDVITGINSPSNAPVTLTGGGGKDKFSFDLNAFSGDNIGRVAPVKALVTDFTTAVTPNSANSKDFLEFDLASGIAATVNTSFVTVNNQMSTLVKVCVGASSIAEITLQGTVLGFGSADYGFI